jgi:integrase
LTLADARDKAKVALAAITQGNDPAAEKREEREAATFGHVAREYLERHAKVKKRSWREDQRILDHDVLPAWRNRRAKDVTALDVRALLDAIVDRGASIQANRTFAIIRRVFNWAAAPDRALVPQSHNPCRGLERPAPERQRERVLTPDELRAVWQALDDEDRHTAALFRLYLLTAQRGGELRTMQWPDIDLTTGWWTIPAERAKNGLAHRVPLSPQALTVLRNVSREDGVLWVFPTTRGSASGYRARIYDAVDRIKERSRVDFVPHDLRRTVATFLTSELGVSRLVVSKLLNHIETGVTKVYDRASYDREKQAALVAWGLRLEAIVSGETATAKVIPMSRA